MELHQAARNGAVDEVRALIASGVSVDAKDKHRRTALHLAAWAGHVEVMDALLRAKADVNALANDCFTPLHFCVQKGSLEGCALLLRRKANTNAAVSKSGRTSLHMAAAKGNAQLCELLLQNRANVLAKTRSGETVLDLAKDEKVTEILSSAIRLLQENKHQRTTAPSEDWEAKGLNAPDEKHEIEASEVTAATQPQSAVPAEKEVSDEGFELSLKRPSSTQTQSDARSAKKPKSVALPHLLADDVCL